MNARDLPIFEIERPLLAALAKLPRAIVTAPTGSGKSTQVPQMLREAGKLDAGQVVILQPRRLPTRLLAGWVAQQRGVKLGDEVGYQIRFDDVTSPRTRIRYVTEGILLRQMLTDPTLSGVQAIVFDEFHERHLYGDLTLARALDLQLTARPDLPLIVMSATLDIAALEKYLAPCTVLSSAGRMFPVAVEYLARSVAAVADRGHSEPIWDVAAQQLARLFARQPDGDALVFMPGAYEIQRTVQAVRDRLGAGAVVLPLHGDLPVADQDAAVTRYDRRKVVVATNVAETSLTIDGIRLVVDSGLARIPRYDPHRGINTLLVEKISRAAADQRAGRAGRTAPGHCLRLWTARDHEQRAAQELPEVKRLDLAEIVLTLKASGVEDVANFRWLEPPDGKSLARAEQLLLDLGALKHSDPTIPSAPLRAGLVANEDGGAAGRKLEACPPPRARATITELGRRMLAFPVHPRYARMLMAAGEYGCVRPVALIAALTQGRELLARRPGRDAAAARDELWGGETESDFFVLMRAWRYAERNGYNLDRCRRAGIQAQAARLVGPLFEQFLEIARREGLADSLRNVGAASPPRPDAQNRGGDAAPTSATPNQAIQKCVLLGFSDHVARRLDAGTLRCALVHGRRGVLARESVVTAPLLVAAEVAEVQGRDLNVLLSLATAVREEWLRELFPDDLRDAQAVVFDPTQRRVVAQRERRFRDLVLEQKSDDDVPADAAARLLAQEVAAGRLVLNEWTEAVEQWIVRVNHLREWMPELELPAITAADRQHLFEQICHGATSYKEIKDRTVWPVVKHWLSPAQQAAVDQHAPERIELPGGRRAKVQYPTDGPPVVAARIQDLYGVKDGLWVAQWRVPVRIEVLAPNHRPVQVTDNLARFWQETYPRLKPELQRKYPKHEWR